MAEQYIPGKQKIFYKSTGLKEVYVRVTLFDSELNNHLDWTLLYPAFDKTTGKLIIGLYWFEHVFYKGIYVAYFQEHYKGEWVDSGVQVYNIKEDFKGGFRSSLGDNVINT